MYTQRQATTWSTSVHSYWSRNGSIYRLEIWPSFCMPCSTIYSPSPGSSSHYGRNGHRGVCNLVWVACITDIHAGSCWVENSYFYTIFGYTFEVTMKEATANVLFLFPRPQIDIYLWVLAIIIYVYPFCRVLLAVCRTNILNCIMGIVLYAAWESDAYCK